MVADAYLFQILARETVDASATSNVWFARNALLPVLTRWGGSSLLDVSPSGSFAKGTANRSGTDLDLFLSLSYDTRETLKQIYDSLHQALLDAGLSPRRQNVSLGVRIAGVDVDLVPGKRQTLLGGDHSLYRRKADTWMKTNVTTHVDFVRSHGRLQETRLLKLWRNQKQVDLPSFYLELAVIRALPPGTAGGLADRVWKALDYLANGFESARFIDPSNTNNIVSDDLTGSEKLAVKRAAQRARSARNWGEIVT